MPTARPPLPPPGALCPVVTTENAPPPDMNVPWGQNCPLLRTTSPELLGQIPTQSTRPLLKGRAHQPPENRVSAETRWPKRSPTSPLSSGDTTFKVTEKLGLMYTLILASGTGRNLNGKGTLECKPPVPHPSPAVGEVRNSHFPVVRATQVALLCMSMTSDHCVNARAMRILKAT